MFWKKKKENLERSRDFYIKPDDVKFLETHGCPVASKRFSVELLKLRQKDMDEETLARSRKTILALRTGQFYGKNYG